MGEIVHDQTVAGELTGALRRSSKQAAAESLKVKAMGYTNLAEAGRAVGEHQAFSADGRAMDAAVQEVAAKIVAFAANFADLDRQQAKAIKEMR